MWFPSPWMESPLRWCHLRYWNYPTLSTLFPDSATQLLGFQSCGCQYQLAGMTSHHLLWSSFGSPLVYSSFSFSVVTWLFLHFFFSKSMCLSCLNFLLLRDLMSFLPPLRLLTFFHHLIASFEVNFSCLFTNDQSAFIQLCTKWNLLCASLLGYCHPLNFSSVENYSASQSHTHSDWTYFCVGS